MRVISRIIIGSLLIMAVGLSIGQDVIWENVALRSFDQEALDEYLLNPDYIYEKDIVAKEGFWDRIRRMFFEYVNKHFKGEISTASKIFNYLIAGLALFIILYYVLSIRNIGFFRKKQAQNRKLDHSILNELEEEDLQALLVQAKKNRNLEMIVRLEYLLILKEMTANEPLEWQAYKTNLDYYFELEDPELKDLFTKVVDWFEYSWYGDFQLNEELIAKAELDFTKMKTKLAQS